MVKDQDNIHVFGGEDDTVWLGELGSTLPTGLAAPTAQEDAGFLSEDGMTLSRDADVQEFRVHQAGKVVRKKVTSSSKKISFTAVEDNPVVRAIVDKIKSSTTAAGVTTEVISDATEVWVGNAVVDLYDDGHMERYVIPRFEVVSSGEEEWSSSALRSYACEGTIVGDYTRITGPIPAP